VIDLYPIATEYSKLEFIIQTLANIFSERSNSKVDIIKQTPAVRDAWGSIQAYKSKYFNFLPQELLGDNLLAIINTTIVTIIENWDKDSVLSIEDFKSNFNIVSNIVNLGLIWKGVVELINRVCDPTNIPQKQTRKRAQVQPKPKPSLTSNDNNQFGYKGKLSDRKSVTIGGNRQSLRVQKNGLQQLILTKNEITFNSGENFIQLPQNDDNRYSKKLFGFNMKKKGRKYYTTT